MVFFYGIMIADKLELGLPQWLGKERRSRNLSVFVSFDSVGFSIASEIGILRRNRLQLSGPDQVDDGFCARPGGVARRADAFG